MKVKEFIKKLSKLDKNAEVVTYDPENDFYSAVRIYKDEEMDDWKSWVSLEDKPRPKKIVYVAVVIINTLFFMTKNLTKEEEMGAYRNWAMGPCFYCGQNMYRIGCYGKDTPDYAYTRDHLIPKKIQKKFRFKKFITVPCCNKCNAKKGSKLPDTSVLKQFGIRKRGSTWYVINSI
jgi:hypothetical protein